jgi:hypothetical protein
MASIDEKHRSGRTPTATSHFSGVKLILLAVAAVIIGVMLIGGGIGVFSGNDDLAPAALNDGAPTIGVEDPNIVVEQPGGAETAPLTGEAQGTTMTTVPTNPIDDTTGD